MKWNERITAGKAWTEKKWNERPGACAARRPLRLRTRYVYAYRIRVLLLYRNEGSWDGNLTNYWPSRTCFGRMRSNIFTAAIEYYPQRNLYYGHKEVYRDDKYRRRRKIYGRCWDRDGSLFFLSLCIIFFQRVRDLKAVYSYERASFSTVSLGVRCSGAFFFSWKIRPNWDSPIVGYERGREEFFNDKNKAPNGRVGQPEKLDDLASNALSHLSGQSNQQQ